MHHRALSPLARLAALASRKCDDADFVKISGRVTSLSPGFVTVAGLSRFVTLGNRVEVEARGGRVLGEVIRVDGALARVKLFEDLAPVAIGAWASVLAETALYPCEAWKGRALDALGAPIDGEGALETGTARLCGNAGPPGALTRARVRAPIRTGIRAIDLFTPMCEGQRIGIFAGSGVGKSTLLAMLAQSHRFDTTVLALVGERGREVREFLEDALEGRAAAAISIVATGDESPMLRRLAPITAMRIAEFFRDRGDRVLLILDSITRYAHALREVAIAAGEPPVARGFAPSVFSDLPKLLERAGPGVEGSGSITGVFSVLVDGDDHNDPVSDCVRGLLDGHIVLDRAIADAGRYPAINVLGSLSRLPHLAWDEKQTELTGKLKSMIRLYEDSADLRLMGGYQSGADADLDRAIKLVPRIYAAIAQTRGGGDGDADIFDAMHALISTGS